MRLLALDSSNEVLDHFLISFSCVSITESINTKIMIELTMETVLCLQRNLTVLTRVFAKKELFFEVLQFSTFNGIIRT